MIRLITFSGSVGSGKSHSAKWITTQLKGYGLNARYIRYRFIRIRDIFGKRIVTKGDAIFKTRQRKKMANLKYVLMILNR